METNTIYSCVLLIKGVVKEKLGADHFGTNIIYKLLDDIQRECKEDADFEPFGLIALKHVHAKFMYEWTKSRHLDPKTIYKHKATMDSIEGIFLPPVIDDNDKKIASIKKQFNVKNWYRGL